MIEDDDDDVDDNIIADISMEIYTAGIAIMPRLTSGLTGSSMPTTAIQTSRCITSLSLFQSGSRLSSKLAS